MAISLVIKYFNVFLCKTEVSSQPLMICGIKAGGSVRNAFAYKSLVFCLLGIYKKRS